MSQLNKNSQTLASLIEYARELPEALDTSDATATASDILSGKTAYVDGEMVTGSIMSKAATTYTPSTANQTIAAGQYLSGAQTIEGDSNLKADNIAEGVSIFGVLGALKAGGELNSASGSAKGGGGTTFTVTGLAFTPSILLITAPVGNSTRAIQSAIGTVDFVYAVGNYMRGGVFETLAWASAGTFTSDGGCTLNLSSFSGEVIRFDTSVNYTWYAYGV